MGAERARPAAVALVGVAALLALAGLFALQALTLDGAETSPGEVTFDTLFLNRSGFVFFNETLRLENATAFTALDRAAALGNFTYHVTYYPGFGSREAGTFVDEVRGERAERGSPDGWIYRVQRNGTWVVPDRSAALYALEEGDFLVWAWTTAWDGWPGRGE